MSPETAARAVLATIKDLDLLGPVIRAMWDGHDLVRLIPETPGLDRAEVAKALCREIQLDPEAAQASKWRGPALPHDHVDILLDLAHEGDEATFRDLAQSVGVEATALDALWPGTRQRLGLR